MSPPAAARSPLAGEWRVNRAPESLSSGARLAVRLTELGHRAEESHAAAAPTLTMSGAAAALLYRDATGVRSGS